MESSNRKKLKKKKTNKSSGKYGRNKHHYEDTDSAYSSIVTDSVKSYDSDDSDQYQQLTKWKNKYEMENKEKDNLRNSNELLNNSLKQCKNDCEELQEKATKSQEYSLVLAKLVKMENQSKMVDRDNFHKEIDNLKAENIKKDKEMIKLSRRLEDMEDNLKNTVRNKEQLQNSYDNLKKERYMPKVTHKEYTNILQFRYLKDELQKTRQKPKNVLYI